MVVVTKYKLTYENYNRLMTSFPGQPGQASTGKVKPVWIKMRQEMTGLWDGSGINSTIRKLITL